MEELCIALSITNFDDTDDQTARAGWSRSKSGFGSLAAKNEASLLAMSPTSLSATGFCSTTSSSNYQSRPPKETAGY